MRTACSLHPGPFASQRELVTSIEPAQGPLTGASPLVVRLMRVGCEDDVSRPTWTNELRPFALKKMTGPMRVLLLVIATSWLLCGGVVGARAKGPRWWKLSHTVDATTFLSNEILSNSLVDHTLPEVVQALLRKKQRRLVRENHGALLAVARGTKSAALECQHQFRERRWNCSHSQSGSYGRIASIPCRETSFIYAIIAAAVMHAITRACTEGSIRTCTCDYNAQGLPGYSQYHQHQERTNIRFLSHMQNDLHAQGRSWEWGGCSEDVSFGYKFSRAFVDAGERGRSVRSVMNLHNNEAGRRHVRSSMRLKCKCHGMSGSCTVRSCWWRLPNFRRVGALLKEHFDGASEVVPTEAIASLQNEKRPARRKKQRRRKRAKAAFRPANSALKFPSRRDLIYFASSPNFCVADRHLGIPGTSGRTCNVTSRGLDGCELMCCGRGYATQAKIIQERCSCTFHWCCEVKCKTCYKQKTIHLCR